MCRPPTRSRFGSWESWRRLQPVRLTTFGCSRKELMKLLCILLFALASHAVAQDNVIKGDLKDFTINVNPVETFTSLEISTFEKPVPPLCKVPKGIEVSDPACLQVADMLTVYPD